MKLKTEEKKYESLGVESKTFSVDTNDTMIIKLLRDKMYKNKIAAVCREVVSNSRDANREAGRSEVPVVVEITNSLGSLISDEETYITFQDNGIGISPERMDNIFLKYGGSTKRDTDEYTGGFGIGAKTPFAYSNEFVIITIVEEKGVRTKYEYQAVISSNGKSEVSRMLLLGSEVTQEQTGTKICVPIKEEDRNTFEKELIFVVSLWEVKPILKGFNQKITLEVIKETKEYILMKDTKEGDSLYGDKSIIGLIDEIPYLLNSDSLKRYYNLFGEVNSQLRNVTNTYIVLKYNVGEISVSGSREDVEYIEDNLAKFKNSLDKFINDVALNIENFLNSAKSYYEACKFGNILRGNQSYYMSRSIDWEVKGWNKNFLVILSKLSSLDILGYDEDKSFKVFNGIKSRPTLSLSTYEMQRYKMQNDRMLKQSYFNNSIGTNGEGEESYYLMDLAKAEPTRNATLKLKHPNGYILLRQKRKEEINQYQYENGIFKGVTFEQKRKEEDKVLELLGIKLKPYSEVEKLKKQKSNNRNTTDIVSVATRYRTKETNWRDNSWTNLTLKFDKNSNQFHNLEVDLKQLIANGKISSSIKSIAYYEKEKLSDFDDTRKNYGTKVPGISDEENLVRQILANSGVLLLGVSSKSAKAYFEKSNVKSLKDSFQEILNNKVGDNVKNSIKYSIVKNSSLDLSIFRKLKLDTKVKKSITSLREFQTEIENNLKTELVNLIRVTKDIKFKKEFLDKYNVEFEKEFDKNLKNYNEFLENNKMIKFIVEVQSQKSLYGTNFNKNHKGFIAGVDSFIDLFNEK